MDDTRPVTLLQLRSYAEIGEVLRRKGRTLVLWDIDETLLTRDRTEWVDERSWNKWCLDGAGRDRSHLVLSAGTTHDVWSQQDGGLMQSYAKKFGVSSGRAVYTVPYGTTNQKFTLMDVLGISTNPTNLHLCNDREIYLPCSKLEVVAALASRPDLFDRVVFVDNNLHELGLVYNESLKYHEFVAWAQQRKVKVSHISLIHFRTGPAHPVLPIMGGLCGVPEDASIKMFKLAGLPRTVPVPTRPNATPKSAKATADEMWKEVLRLLRESTQGPNFIPSAGLVRFITTDLPIIHNPLRCPMMRFLQICLRTPRRNNYEKEIEQLLQTWEKELPLLS